MLVKNAIGKELVLDIHDCDSLSKLNTEEIKKFVIELCDFIDMTRTEVHVWEYFDDPDKDPEEFYHLEGISLIQFIKTSNITVHTFYNSLSVSLNIFSCKDFNEIEATEFCRKWFNGEIVNSVTIPRY